MSTTLKQFIAEQGIESETEWADDNPNAVGFSPDARHFRVTLRARGGEMVVPFSQGPAVSEEPGAADVLDSLASDINLLEDEGESDGVKLAVRMGDKIESVEAVEQAQEMALTIERQRVELGRILGADALNQLRYNVERL